jgi:hypothetical protein
MAQKAVVDAVAARLAANFSACPVIGLNLTGETPSDGNPFLLVDFPLADCEQISIGAPGQNLYRESGMARFVVHAERGRDLGAPRTWADALAGLFRDADFAGILTGAPTSPAEGEARIAGNYWQIAFLVPFEFDFTG